MDEERVPLADQGVRYFTLRNERARDEYGDLIRREDGSFVMAQWGEMVVPIHSGDLAGYTARIRLELLDGEILQGPINLDPGKPRPFESTNQVLHAIRLGDVIDDIERCLRNLASQTTLDDAFAWLDAYLATRKRPGRKGSPELIWARIAARRVEAESERPGNAIRYMRQTWPADFTSDASASQKVNRAVKKGMLHFDSARTPHLTDQARRLLDLQEDQ